MPRFDPQYPTIIFGNGAQARAIRMIPNVPAEDGVLETVFYLEPTPEMKHYHNIDNRLRDEQDLIAVSYPSKLVKPLNMDPIIHTHMVLCDFEFGDTPFTKEYPDPKVLNDYIEENRMLRGYVAKLEDEKIKMLDRLNKEMDQAVKVLLTAKKVGNQQFEAGYVPTTEASQESPGEQ